MKTLFVLIGFLRVALGIYLFGVWVYGAYLAFKASVLLGFLALLLEPSPTILGLMGVFHHPEVAQKIAAWLGLGG
jgi:hypothetical protein